MCRLVNKTLVEFWMELDLADTRVIARKRSCSRATIDVLDDELIMCDVDDGELPTPTAVSLLQNQHAAVLGKNTKKPQKCPHARLSPQEL